jgi:hypothetical protein
LEWIYEVASTGHRLPVFSLQLDPPPHPDEELAQLVRLCSREREARPVGIVDDLIRQIQARQQHAAPIQLRVLSGREGEEMGTDNDKTGAEAGGARHRKKRGSSSSTRPEVPPAPSHLHLMYREEDEGKSSREGEDDEGGDPDA